MRRARKKKWLAIARDDSLQGSHILVVEAEDIKAAYDECAYQCALHGLNEPERRAVYELRTGEKHICTVLDAQYREGLFNGRVALSIAAGTACATTGSGAVRNEHTCNGAYSQ